MIKVLSEFGCGNERSLLLEIPQHLLQNIDIRLDGSVNTKSLIEVMQRYYEYQQTAKELAEDGMTGEQWMDFIMSAKNLPEGKI